MRQRSTFIINTAVLGMFLLSFTLFSPHPAWSKRSFKEDLLIKKTVQKAGAGQMKRIFKKEKIANLSCVVQSNCH